MAEWGARRANESPAQLAEGRYVALERQLTPLLIARHELPYLLQKLHREVRRTDESHLPVARDDDTFLYARRFIALEDEPGALPGP